MTSTPTPAASPGLYPHQQRLLELLQRQDRAVVEPVPPGLGVNATLIEAAATGGARRVLVIDHRPLLTMWAADLRRRFPDSKPQLWDSTRLSIDEAANWVITTPAIAERGAAAIAAAQFDACIIRCPFNKPAPELRAALKRVPRVWIVGEKEEATIRVSSFLEPDDSGFRTMSSQELLRLQGFSLGKSVAEEHAFKYPAASGVDDPLAYAAELVRKAQGQAGTAKTLVVSDSLQGLQAWRDDLLQADSAGVVQFLHEDGEIDPSARWILAGSDTASAALERLNSSGVDSCVLLRATSFEAVLLAGLKTLWTVSDDGQVTQYESSSLAKPAANEDDEHTLRPS